MKELTKALNKAKAILAGKKGESLMESVASILIFNLLMLAVAVMIKTSLRITEYSTRDASSRQEWANDAILEEYDPDFIDATNPISYLELQDIGVHGIDVKIPVIFYDDGTFQAFTPATSGVT